MRRVVLVVGSVLVLSCKKDPDPFVVSLRGPVGVTPFAEPVTSVELRVRGEDGIERGVARLSPRDTSFEVPDSAKAGVGSLTLAGLAADGSIVEYGRTPVLELSGLAGRATLKLSILVQKTRTFVDAVGLAGAVAKPICANVGARYAIVGDSTALHADVIDLLDASVRREEAFDVKPTTIATAGALTLVIDESGAGFLLDLERGTSTKQTTSFADVVGGMVLRDDTGGAWIVGPTRKTATDTVMRLDSSGTLVTRKLLGKRSSAAATWITGRGLVVAYGTSPMMDEAGIEILAPGATSSVASTFPADHRAGGVVTARDGSKLLRIDEDGVATTLDLACAKECVPAGSMVTDEKRAPRADDHATSLEGSSALIVRGGRISLLEGEKLTLLRDAGERAVCSAALGTGNALVMIAGASVAHTVAPAR